MKCRVMDWIALILVVVGAFNWGLIGLFNFNLVDALFGLVVGRIIYVIVGLSGIWMLFFAAKCHRSCPRSNTPPPTNP